MVSHFNKRLEASDIPQKLTTTDYTADLAL